MTVTIEPKDGRACVMVTMSGMDDCTVLEHDEGMGDGVPVSSSARPTRLSRPSKHPFHLSPGGP